MLKKNELLSPAGNWSALKSAVASGADSVYFGVKNINMRHQANNFDMLEVPKVMAYLREHNKKGYLTLNTIIQQDDLPRARRILEVAKEASVDAVILWDMAVLAIARELKIPIHVSTQASVASSEAVRFYEKLGAERVVLARECTLADIRKIVSELEAQKSRCEIEAFIHGAMCVSISGRCFMSLESFGKSANEGQCLQPCRREYVIKDKDGEAEYILGEDYVLSPKDLCALEFLDQLIEAGVHCFKIEGRMRQSEYVGLVTGAYREAIDAYFAGGWSEDLKQVLLGKLQSVYHRGFSSGFYFGRPGAESMGHALEQDHEKVYLGEVKKFYNRIGVADIRIRQGEMRLGEKVLISGNATPASFATIAEMEIDHAAVDRAGRGQAVGVKLPFEVRPKDKVFLWKKKGKK